MEKSNMNLSETLQVNLIKRIKIIGEYKDKSGAELSVFQVGRPIADLIFVILSKAYFEALELSSQFSKIE